MTLKRDEIDLCLQRLGATPDGKVLRHQLLLEVQAGCSEAASDGAVRAFLGRRNYAAHLLSKLSPKPDGRSDPDHTLAERPARAVPVGSGAGGRRRVPDTDE